MSAQDNLSPKQFYHGSRSELSPGDIVTPGYRPTVYDDSTEGVKLGGRMTHAFATTDKSLAEHYAHFDQPRKRKNRGEARVYPVEPVGAYEPDPESATLVFEGGRTYSRPSTIAFRSKEGWRVK